MSGIGIRVFLSTIVKLILNGVFSLAKISLPLWRHVNVGFVALIGLVSICNGLNVELYRLNEYKLTKTN